MAERINIQEYLDMLKRRKWIIILIVILSLALGGFRMYQNYISYVPRYESTVLVKIDTMKTAKEKAAKEREKAAKKKSKNSDNTDDSDEKSQSTDGTDTTDESQPLFNYSALAQDEAIASRYYNYVTEEAVYKKVAQVAGVRVKDVQSISATQNEEKPEQIQIRVVSGNKASAEAIAKAIPTVYGDVLLKETGYDCVSMIYDEPTSGSLIRRSTDTSIPKYGFGGLVIAIFIVLLLEMLNTKIITPDDVEKYWELPLLGVVPEFDDVPHRTVAKGHHGNKNVKNGKAHS